MATLSMKLRSYDKKYALHPVSQIRAMTAYAEPEVERSRAREAYLRRPQNLQAVETPLRLPQKSDNSTTVISRGESLASLGPRLKQIAFLGTMGLYPPDDELDLDAWVANRLRELRFKGPSTLENWMKIGTVARNTALNTEMTAIEDEKRKRMRDGNAKAYQLENDEFKDSLLTIEPDQIGQTPNKRRNFRKSASELGAIDIDAPKPRIKMQEVRGGSLRKAALAARLAILEQSNEGRRKPMGLEEVQQASSVEEADDGPPPPPRPMPPPFDESFN